MARGKVTQDSVNALQAGDRDYFVWDDKLAGFGVKVTPKGAKIYVLQYRLGGRGTPTRRYTIGPEGKLRTASARKEAERLALLVGQGVDVVDQRKAKVQKVEGDKAFGFKSYLDGAAKERFQAKWPKAWGQAHARLTKYAAPFFNEKPLPEITKDDVRRLMKSVADKQATARNLWAGLSFLFNEAVKADDLAESPMKGLEPPKPSAQRDNVLDHDHLRWMWDATHSLGAPYGPLLRLLTLLGQRRNEVGGLPWAELDRKAGMWSLPAERAKNGEANLIPLPDLAIAELDALAGGENWPRRGFVFAARGGKTAVSGFSKAKRRIDALMAKAAAKEDAKVEPWVIHDLRRTLATNLQALGVDFAVTEHLLNHKEQTRAGIAKVYQRHGYKAEKRAALALWEAELGRIVADKPATVIPLRRA